MDEGNGVSVCDRVFLRGQTLILPCLGAVLPQRILDPFNAASKLDLCATRLSGRGF